MRWLTRAFGGDARALRDTDAALRGALLAVLERDYDRAEELLARAVRIDSGAIDGFLALARLYRTRGEISRAIQIHQNLLLRKDLEAGQRVSALADLAEDFRKAGLLRRALACHEEVLAHEPRHLVSLRAVVRLLADLREHSRAIDFARRLARVEGRRPGPEEAALWVESAEAAHAEGRSDDARRALEQALRRDPRCVPAWIQLGVLEAERGRSKAALAAWRRVPEIDRRSGPLVYPRLEASFAALGRARGYEQMLQGLLDEHPEDFGARLALARALAARGESEGALAELRRLLERDPEGLEAHCAQGRVLLAAGRDAEALRAYCELLDLLETQGYLGPRESSA